MLNHFRLFFPPKQSALAKLYFTVGFLNIGLSLVGIFVPIYIYQLTESFYWLAGFMIALSLGVLLFTIPTARLVGRMGIFKAVFFSTLVRITYFLLLLAAPRFLPFIIFAGILEGLLVPLFWLPYHLIYVREGKDGWWGHQIGLMNLVTILTSFPAPFLGGFIVTNFGFSSLYLLGLGLVFLSALPLLWVRDFVRIEPFLPEKLLKEFTKSNYRPLFLGFGGLQLEGAVGFLLWPLFVFELTQSFTTLGAIASVSVLVGLLANFFGAEFIDRVGSRRILPFGAVANAFTWAVLGFATAIPVVFGIALVRSVLGVFYAVPASAITYSLAQKAKPFAFLIQREFALHSVCFIAAILLAILWYFFPENWPVLFTPAVVGSLMAVLLAYAKNR